LEILSVCTQEVSAHHIKREDKVLATINERVSAGFFECVKLLLHWTTEFINTDSILNVMAAKQSADEIDINGNPNMSALHNKLLLRTWGISHTANAYRQSSGLLTSPHSPKKSPTRIRHSQNTEASTLIRGYKDVLLELIEDHEIAATELSIFLKKRRDFNFRSFDAVNALNDVLFTMNQQKKDISTFTSAFRRENQAITKDLTTDFAFLAGLPRPKPTTVQTARETKVTEKTASTRVLEVIPFLAMLQRLAGERDSELQVSFKGERGKAGRTGARDKRIER
jgi:hypothetical protein